MKNEYPYNHKNMGKVLFAAFRRQLPAGRCTRSYLRRQARNLEHAYEIGYRDGAAGKALVPLKQVCSIDSTALAADMIRYAYTVYCAGHHDGAMSPRR